MSATYLTAMDPPEHLKETKSAGDAADEQPERMRHALVQKDPDTCEESVVVTWTCLSYIEEAEEDGTVRRLEYEEGRQFIENLLGPAARPPHLTAVDYSSGDVCFFDNIQVSHAVSPTNAYASGEFPESRQWEGVRVPSSVSRFNSKN